MDLVELADFLGRLTFKKLTGSSIILWKEPVYFQRTRFEFLLLVSDDLSLDFRKGLFLITKTVWITV